MIWIRQRPVCAFRQIPEALVYLHAQGLAHRDLKPANILVKSVPPLHVLLSDFGLVGRDTLTTFCGSHRYCAPEIYFAKSKKLPYSNMVGIWSVGVMILEHVVLIDDLPEPSAWIAEQWLDTVGHGRCKSPKRGWERLMNLANLMLIQNPYHRPIAVTCLSTVSDSSLSNPERVRTLTSAGRNPLPPKAYKNIVAGQITIDILQTWMNQDASKDPRVAINLTEIYGAIGLTRHTMRGDLKGASRYALRLKLESSSQGASRGTYVSLDTAIIILEARAPNEEELLKSLKELRRGVSDDRSVPISAR